MTVRMDLTAVIVCDTDEEATVAYDLASKTSPGIDALESLTRDGNTITVVYKQVVDDAYV